LTALSPTTALVHARVALRRAAVRRQLQAVAAGNSGELAIDLGEPGVDVVAVVDQVVRQWRVDSSQMQRLAWSFERSGVAARAVDGLAASGRAERERSTRFVGAMQMEEVVPWVAPLLGSPDRALSEGAARALGRIGGVRSAEALLVAIQRVGARRVFITELARSAPDLFVEVALGERLQPQVVHAVAIAAGLRRRHTAIAPLLALLARGNRRERVIACRSLGWIGADGVTAALVEALDDREWKVRLSAAKSLGALRCAMALPGLQKLQADNNPRVRKAATYGIRQIGPVAVLVGAPWL
jgi:HEAT repeat protein